MVSIVWNPKFGGQGIIYKYILNLNDCTFEHGRVLGRTNSKNSYKVIQKWGGGFQKSDKKCHREEPLQSRKWCHSLK